MGTLSAMTRVSGSGYDVSRAKGVCAATGTPIRPGDAYVAAVVERAGEEGLERLDYGADAWAGGARPVSPVFAHWRAVMDPPGENRRQVLDDAALADLFEQTADGVGTGEGGGAGRAGVAFRYLLALMLVRRKFLRHEGSRPGVMLVRWTGRSGRAGDAGPAVEVEEPAMDAEAMGRAADEMGKLFLGAARGGA